MTIIKTFETTEEPKRFPKKFLFLIILIIFPLILIEIWASNTVVSFGDKYEKLSNLERGLKVENRILENEIAENSALKLIASKAAELGFSSQQSIQYIR